MNEELQTELEIVELGDAKEETKGMQTGPLPEDVAIYNRFDPN